MKMKLFISTVGVVILSTFLSIIHAQDPVQYGKPFNGVPDIRDAVIYQVNMRAFSSTRDFQGVIKRLDNIKALGVNVIYLMPIYPVGVYKSVQSPYCVKDYNSVNTEFGTLTDLRNLIDAAHNKGMAVILDWVANHTSMDHPWTTEHKEWYKQDTSGNIIAPNSDWKDVAQLNFSNSEMREAMINAMRYWVFNANCDGFRFDYVDGPPVDFWKQAISSLRDIKSHKLLLFAEGTRSLNYTAGFDYNFGMNFYFSSLKPIFNNNQSVTSIDKSNVFESDGAAENQEIIRYTTNHDVNGAEGTPLELFGGKRGSMVAFVVAAYMKGIPMIYNGQEVAFPERITFPFLSTTIDWSQNADVTAEYSKIIAFRNNSAAIKRGALASYSNNDVCAFIKASDSEKVFVICNMRDSLISYSIPEPIVNTTWTDVFANTSVTLDSVFSLPAYTYRVLKINTSGMPVNGISINKSASIEAGAVHQLTATITPVYASSQEITWTSSDTSVAKVSSKGIVSGLADGIAIITVKTTSNEKAASCVVTVKAKKSITVYFYKPLNWGTSINIYYWNVLPEGTMERVVWPGVAMATDANGWYKYTFIANKSLNLISANMIFNDGTNQSVDLVRDKDGWCVNNKWFDRIPDMNEIANTK